MDDYIPKFKKGETVKIYQKYLTEEDYEGEFKLVKFVCLMGFWTGQAVERWVVKDKEGQCQRTILVPLEKYKNN